MPQAITTLTLPLPFRMGSVNCYLVQTGAGFVLIDTGPSTQRAAIEGRLVSAGCQPGNLALIALTHGDFDHTGNAAYLRDRFGASIAMHPDDWRMAERGDMFSNRASGNPVMRWLVPVLSGFSKANRFTPDLRLEDGCDLSRYGLDALVLSIPGHSKGSIGLLMAGGDLICGDLLENVDQPAFNSIMDDPASGEASIGRLSDLGVATVYPGHGQPFLFNRFLDRSHRSGKAEG